MRKIKRLPISRRASAYLRRKESQLRSCASVDKLWKAVRKTKTMGAVFGVLKSMAGERERCMYCEDSRGTDIDHFRPKAKEHYPELAFTWTNMLLLCAGCNRKKGVQFKLDANGEPLLIDPCVDDPWDHLFFDENTGFLVARWVRETSAPDPRGEYTTSPEILPLNIEPVASSRQRTFRRLKRTVESFLATAAVGENAHDGQDDLMSALSDNDDFGLIEWFFHREGREAQPFVNLAARYPGTWHRIQQRFVRH